LKIQIFSNSQINNTIETWIISKIILNKFKRKIDTLQLGIKILISLKWLSKIMKNKKRKNSFTDSYLVW